MCTAQIRLYNRNLATLINKTLDFIMQKLSCLSWIAIIQLASMIFIDLF